MSRCECCALGIHRQQFTYDGHALCCECMSALCSWFLDGGQVEAPEMFADIVETEAV
jgi:hypothetical protein